jgi:hypothetical protein
LGIRGKDLRVGKRMKDYGRVNGGNNGKGFKGGGKGKGYGWE